MGSPQQLGRGPARASPPYVSSVVPPYAPPTAAWQPSTMVRRAPVKIARPSGLFAKAFSLAVLAAIVAGAWYYQVVDLVTPSSPRATAKAFMGAIYGGDIGRAQELCTTATLPLLAPLKQVASRAEDRPQTVPPRELSWRADAVEVTGDTATVTIAQTLTETGSAQSSEFPLTLGQENGKWKVELTGGSNGGQDMVVGLSGLVGWR
jgi:hypothetical protein